MASQVSLIQTNTVQSGVFNITFSVYNNLITPAFTQLIADFGEPILTIGGTYTPGGSVPAFTWPTQVLRLISDLPVNFVFDPANPILSATYTQQQAAYFAAQYLTAFDAAVTALVAKSDTFSGQTITNFPY